MGLYEQLSKRKQNGEIIDIDSISTADLKLMWHDEGLSDAALADLFSLTKAKFVYQSKKRGITLRKCTIQDVFKDQKLNADAFQWTNNPDNLETIARALTHFAFRNGPVENMHADGKLKDADMMVLNKFMVNHLAHVIKLAQEGRWLELRLIIYSYRHFGTQWDPVETIELNTEELLNLL